MHSQASCDGASHAGAAIFQGNISIIMQSWMHESSETLHAEPNNTLADSRSDFSHS